MSLKEDFVPPENWNWNPYSGNLLSLKIPDELRISKENDYVSDSFESFAKWLKENDFRARRYERNHFRVMLEEQPEVSYNPILKYSWEIFLSDEWPFGPDVDVYEFSQEEKHCGFCGHVEHSNSLMCHECGTLFFCTCCAKYRTAAHYDVTSQMTNCANCGVQCECGRFHSGYMSTCSFCNPVFQCRRCGSWQTEELEPLNGIDCCNSCVDCFCHHCEEFRDEYDEQARMMLDDDGNNICGRCQYLGSDGDKEEFEENDGMAATKLQLPSIPGREMIRLSGVEIEGGYGKVNYDQASGLNGPNYLARKLYDNDLSRNYQQVGYHHGDGFARIETDASCDWECVIGPINMADVSHVRKLNNVLKLIKESIQKDYLKLDLRCGTHVHVGAEKVSLGQAFNLHLLYTYMEDVLYRLGAANWPIHRILINDEEHSAQRSPKENSKTKFARRFHGNRYYGLSFNNYFEKMLGECNCGAARYGAFEECTCDLHKCTFEFRLFNATANTIKLHAYLALSQALVAKAISMPEIKNPDEFTEFPFVMKRFRDMNGAEQNRMIEHWEDRLRYIATELPLTDDEKKSIYYCIKNSELVKVGTAKELFKGATSMEVNN